MNITDGSPGAARAIGAVVLKRGHKDCTTLILHLELLGFRGTEVYHCWNDYADRDTDKFFEGVCSEDPIMVAIVNRAMGR